MSQIPTIRSKEAAVEASGTGWMQSALRKGDEFISGHFDDPAEKDRFVASLIELHLSTDVFKNCNKITVAITAAKAASTRLDIPRELAIIPFGTTPKLVLTRDGLVTLAYRSGLVSSVKAGVLPENHQAFECDEGTGHLVYQPALRGLPGETWGYWAKVCMKDGDNIVMYWSAEKMAKFVKDHNLKKNVWSEEKNYDAMAVKTVLKQCLRHAPKVYATKSFSAAMDVDDGRHTALDEKFDRKRASAAQHHEQLAQSIEDAKVVEVTDV